MRTWIILIGLVIASPLCPSFAATAQAAGSDQAAPEQQTPSQGELDQLVAPIALYSDPLLAQVLMAATYPLEIVQAERWARANKSLKGGALDAALAKQDWDASVKALVATPTVLTMMNDQLDWTEKLGDAVLAQQADVMDAIQRLRSKAEANGKLKTTKQQTVSVSKEEGGNEVVTIAPTSSETVYVPYYEPSVVYGTWDYPSYPPYYWPPAPGWVVGGAVATGIAWGVGWAIGNAIWDGFDWDHGNIRVDIDKNVNIDRHVNRNDVKVGNWEHNSYHRRGVNYRNTEVQNKYAKNAVKAGDRKLDYRGRSGEQVLKNVDQRPGGGERPDLGKGPGDKRPDLGKGPGERPGTAGGPDNKRPDLGKGGKPKPKPEAFDLGDGGKARDYSKRGQESLGNRGAADFKKPSGGGGKPQFKGGGGGGGKPQFKGGGGGKPQFKGGGGGGRSMGGGGRGGGRGGGGRGGGRRSDIRLKEDIVPLGRLSSGLELYRFRYMGGDRTTYVGVMAQEARRFRPDAVWRDRSGYLMVDYDRLGLKFMTWKEWQARGGGATLRREP